jgi:hypothetical protein
MKKKPLCVSAGVMQNAPVRVVRSWKTYNEITIRQLKETLLAFKLDAAGNKPHLVASLLRLIELKAVK